MVYLSLPWCDLYVTNKAQGQTILIVCVYLPEPVFSHGQLYVAMSRATAKSNIKILAIKDKGKEQTNDSKKRKRPESLVTTTRNIVDKEFLND